jgi:hypothetical protein
LDSPDAPDDGMIVSVSLNGSRLCLITEISEASDGYDLRLVDYNPAVYDTGAIPPYISFRALEQRKINLEAVEPQPPDLEAMNEAINSRVERVMNGGSDLEPENVASASAKAFQDYIEIAVTPGGSGLAGAVKRLHIQFSKDGGSGFPPPLRPLQRRLPGKVRPRPMALPRQSRKHLRKPLPSLDARRVRRRHRRIWLRLVDARRPRHSLLQSPQGRH